MTWRLSARSGSNPKVVPAAALANSTWQERSTSTTPIGSARTSRAKALSTEIAGAAGRPEAAARQRARKLAGLRSTPRKRETAG